MNLSFSMATDQGTKKDEFKLPEREGSIEKVWFFFV